MTSQLEKPRITEINVRIDCNGCVQKIKKALNGINGIYDLYINLPQQKLIVIGRADPERIIKAIKKVRKVATICSHTEAPEPDSQPTETQPGAQPPEEGTQLDSGNPPSAELNHEAEPPSGPPPQQPPNDQPPQQPLPENQPKDQPPQPPPSENPTPATVDRRPNQPGNRFTPMDEEDCQVTYHNPPANGYRYSNSGYARGYSPGYGEHLRSHPGLSFGHELPPQPSFHKPQHPVYRERPRQVYHDPPSRLVYHAAASQPVYYEPPQPPVYREPPHEQVYYEPSHPPVNHEPPQPPVSHETRQTHVYHEPPQIRAYHEPPQTRAYHEPPQTCAYHDPPQTRAYHEPHQTRAYHEPPQTRLYHEPLHTPTIHEPPQQYVCNEPSAQPLHATHSYNRYRQSPHITEYEYVKSPPRHTTYSRMDYYDMDTYMDPYPQGGASNGYATSAFSDENPNACTIV